MKRNITATLEVSDSFHDLEAKRARIEDLVAAAITADTIDDATTIETKTLKVDTLSSNTVGWINADKSLVVNSGGSTDLIFNTFSSRTGSTISGLGVTIGDGGMICGSGAMIRCHYFSTPNDVGYVSFSNKEVKDIDTVTANKLNVNIVDEKTSNSGVTVDGLLIKDGDIVHSRRYYTLLTFYDSNVSSNATLIMAAGSNGYPKSYFAKADGTIFAIDMLFETGAELNAWTTDNIANNTIQFSILVNNSIVWSSDAYNKTDVSNAPGTNTKAMIVDGLNIALEAGDEINVQYTTGSQYNGTTMEISCALHVYVSNA